MKYTKYYYMVVNGVSNYKPSVLTSFLLFVLLSDEYILYYIINMNNTLNNTMLMEYYNIHKIYIDLDVKYSH